jgi:hypothetical protein
MFTTSQLLAREVLSGGTRISHGFVQPYHHPSETQCSFVPYPFVKPYKEVPIILGTSIHSNLFFSHTVQLLLIEFIFLLYFVI